MTQHLDMAATIAPKSDQINADDLISGPRTITITRVSGNDNADQPVNVFFEGDNNKPFRPCKSMRRVMVAIWGANAQEYVGRSMTLFRDPNVKFGGMQVGGIRISHMSHMDEPKTMSLTETRAKRAPYRVEPLRGPQINPDHQAEARQHAARGRAAFTAWWQSNPDKRVAAKPIMQELQEACTQADNANDDPFGLPPIDPSIPDRPTPEQIAAAEAEAREAARREAEEAEAAGPRA